MSEEQWLRDALDAAVPDAPRSDRLDGVREQRRRASHRRNLLVGTGAAFVVALVAASSVALYPRERSDPTTAAEARDPIYDGPACPGAGGRSGPSRIPADPVSVRLCRGPALAIDAPSDALVVGAGEVANLIDDLPPLPSYPACAGELGRGYRLLFAYADGRTASAVGELGGCRTVTVGSIVRQGADRPLAAFVGLLRSQRATRSPRPHDTAPTCGGGAADAAVSPVADPTEMVRGVYCRLGHGGAGDVGADVGVDVDAADLVTIFADRPRRPPAPGRDDCPATSRWRIVGVTAWGDLTEVRGDCAHYVGFGGRTRVIGADVRQILAGLRREVTGG